ncbi:MAG TPA: hypothetical protein VMB47_12450 [Candidatus Aquilonibacter sp.]|nr:hypothetical protein [Candidatus Aquilonibacter sp.]
MCPKQSWPREVVESEGFHMRDVERRRSAVHTVSASFLGRLTREISYRWRILWGGPNAERTREIDRENRFAERQRLAEEYARGYLEGWHECYAACLEAVEESVSQNCDIWGVGDLLSGTNAPPKMN